MAEQTYVLMYNFEFRTFMRVPVTDFERYFEPCKNSPRYYQFNKLAKKEWDCDSYFCNHMFSHERSDFQVGGSPFSVQATFFFHYNHADETHNAEESEGNVESFA